MGFLIFYRIDVSYGLRHDGENFLLDLFIELFWSASTYMSLTFVFECTFEWKVLWFFIYFQSSCPLEELEPKRLFYQKQEHR